jgi:uncharacterized protein
MLLRETIKLAYDDQQELLKSRNEGAVPRSFLNEYVPASTHAEVVSGIRRCGKSTLMDFIRNRFYPEAAYFNFEDSRVYGFSVHDFQKLDEIWIFR